MQKSSPKETFVEGKDYYFNERGLLVLTGTYLLKRGFCCENNCTHCPYKGDKQQK